MSKNSTHNNYPTKILIIRRIRFAPTTKIKRANLFSPHADDPYNDPY